MPPFSRRPVHWHPCHPTLYHYPLCSSTLTHHLSPQIILGSIQCRRWRPMLKWRSILAVVNLNLSRDLRNGNQLTTDSCPCGTGLGSANGHRKPSEWVPLSILSVLLAGSCLPSLDQVSRRTLTTSMFRTFVHFRLKTPLWTWDYPRKNALPRMW